MNEIESFAYLIAQETCKSLIDQTLQKSTWYMFDWWVT